MLLVIFADAVLTLFPVLALFFFSSVLLLSFPFLSFFIISPLPSTLDRVLHARNWGFVDLPDTLVHQVQIECSGVGWSSATELDRNVSRCHVIFNIWDALLYDLVHIIGYLLSVEFTQRPMISNYMRNETNGRSGTPPNS